MKPNTAAIATKQCHFLSTIFLNVRWHENVWLPAWHACAEDSWLSRWRRWSESRAGHSTTKSITIDTRNSYTQITISRFLVTSRPREDWVSFSRESARAAPAALDPWNLRRCYQSQRNQSITTSSTINCACAQQIERSKSADVMTQTWLRK